MVGRSLARFLAGDRRGVAAVEFALVAPVLLTLAMGLAEVGRFAPLAIEVPHPATTPADLASREETLSTAQLDSMFAAARHAVRPSDMAADGRAIVSCVGRENGGRRACSGGAPAGAGSPRPAASTGRTGR